jgi:hypothetical protein
MYYSVLPFQYEFFYSKVENPATETVCENTPLFTSQG